MVQLQKDTEEAKRLTSTKDIPTMAEISNLKPGKTEEIRQTPGMATEPSYDGFNTGRRGDTLDAFGPLSHRARQP